MMTSITTKWADSDYTISVLDGAVLKIYDDDFVLDSDPNGPLPIAKLWGRIQDLKKNDDMLLKEFAVISKTPFKVTV